ncbi:hypothetical protein BHE74_00040832 [Ensete ventricosum]|nr:hypothetical protein BHE74_00040832 [Ensete ventricosum]
MEQLKKLKSIGVDGVMVDCWWGIVEAHIPQQYNWKGYMHLFQVVRDTKLKLQVYFDFMRNFRVEFDEFFEDGTICEIEIGLGPYGELCYPSHPVRHGWRYPGIGEFQISGIHWWYKTASHAAELTAGFYNPCNRDGYAPIASMLKKHGASLNFTCTELHTLDHYEDFPEAMADPEVRSRTGRYVLVRQLIGTRTARYRRNRSSAIDFGHWRSTVDGQLREKEEEGEEEEGEKYLARTALPRFLVQSIARMIRRPRAIPSPRAGRRNEATCMDNGIPVVAREMLFAAMTEITKMNSVVLNYPPYWHLTSVSWLYIIYPSCLVFIITAKAGDVELLSKYSMLPGMLVYLWQAKMLSPAMTETVTIRYWKARVFQCVDDEGIEALTCCEVHPSLKVIYFLTDV